MKKLTYNTLSEIGNSEFVLQNGKETVLQFGEGNFLRAFVDYFFDIANEKCNLDNKVVVVQPIAQGLAEMVNAQEGLYTHYLRGFENGEKVNSKRLISTISRCINCYEDYDAYLKCAQNPDLRYIVSNTTEAGIVYDETCKFDDAPAASFPAKLTRLMYERFKYFGTQAKKGFVILSCELIDNNGAELKKCVEQHIENWGLEQEFKAWVSEENLFCSTLVDRIVTGYPRTEADELNKENGYEDNLLVTSEVFALWVIEGPKWLEEELPFKKAGLPVIVAEDHTPYKKRKVRILNGAHTSMIMAAYLSGKSIVRECMEDSVIKGFMNKTIDDEIIPTIEMPKQELQEFASAVEERFNNPFIDHSLLAISLNSTSKWRARVMPSFKGYIQKFGKLPACTTLSLASLIAFFKAETGKNAKDDEWIMDFYTANKNADNKTLANLVLTNEKMWGEDLTKIDGLEECIAQMLNDIDANGMYKEMEKALNKA